ncbi:6067_t:CDS:2 [Entrophospora sp. SA101]|nr:6067_t:CDS:2 [Entrophospora sp. SA101]CAJ0924343.1 22583_t:CDS:2 [Entrophospora sp. SA101]
MDSINISQINNELTETQRILQELFKDPLLSDLTKTNTPESLTIEEVDTLIALELGTAFEIIIERGLIESLVLVVRQNATVHDIKKLISIKVERELESQKKAPNSYDKLKKNKNSNQKRDNRKISWKYIWKSYCLIFEGKLLLDDKVHIQELGIRTLSTIQEDLHYLPFQNHEESRDYKYYVIKTVG